MTIHLRDVSFGYNAGADLFRRLDLVVNVGEFAGIVGPNGSGKTTLARLLNGGFKPTAGTVTIDDYSTTEPEHDLLIKRNVAVVSEDPEDQIIASTVWDEVSFALEAQGLSSGEINHRCESVLASCQLEPLRDTHPLLLSTGEQIRVLLAAALARQPRYLVLDEVYDSLDNQTQQTIASLVDQLRIERGLGIILLTHRLDKLLNADRILVLLDGKIAMDDKPLDVFTQALSNPGWQLEPPLLFQVYHSMPAHARATFAGLSVASPGIIATVSPGRSA